MFFHRLIKYSFCMVVYVEAVLLDNFFFDFLLGYLTYLLTKQKVRHFPIALSALVGSGFALAFPLITKYAFLFKIAALLISSLLLTLKKSLKVYLINTFVYALLSFLLSGILCFLLGDKMHNGFIGIKLGGVVALISIGVLLLLYFVRQMIGLSTERKRKTKFAMAEIVNREKSIKISALFDSGNLLTDQNGEGVVVTDQKRLSELGDLPKFGEMCVHTASGSKVLKLVKIPEIRIYSRGHENILFNVTAALSDLPKEYALILPCE